MQLFFLHYLRNVLLTFHISHISYSHSFILFIVVTHNQDSGGAATINWSCQDILDTFVLFLDRFLGASLILIFVIFKSCELHSD